MPARIPVIEEQIRRNVRQKFDLLTTLAFLRINGPSRGRAFGTSSEQQARGKAKHILRTCKKRRYASIPERWNRDDVYRASQMHIDWTEEQVKEIDASGFEDHTYHATSEERG